MKRSDSSLGWLLTSTPLYRTRSPLPGGTPRLAALRGVVLSVCVPVCFGACITRIRPTILFASLEYCQLFWVKRGFQPGLYNRTRPHTSQMASRPGSPPPDHNDFPVLESAAVTCTAAAPLPSQLCCVCDTSLAAGAPAHGRCLPAIATRGVHARCFVEFADWLETRTNLREVLLVWAHGTGERRLRIAGAARVLLLVRRWQRERWQAWAETLRARSCCRAAFTPWARAAKVKPPSLVSSSSEE